MFDVLKLSRGTAGTGSGIQHREATNKRYVASYKRESQSLVSRSKSEGNIEAQTGSEIENQFDQDAHIEENGEIREAAR